MCIGRNSGDVQSSESYRVYMVKVVVYMKCSVEKMSRDCSIQKQDFSPLVTHLLDRIDWDHLVGYEVEKS